MAEQLDLFNFNREFRSFSSQCDLERYKARVADGRLRAFVDRGLILDIGYLLQSASFGWGDSVEGMAYWGSVKTRLDLIGNNIQTQSTGNRDFYPRVLRPDRDF